LLGLKTVGGFSSEPELAPLAHRRHSAMKFGQTLVLSLSSSAAATNLLTSRSSQSLAVAVRSKPRGVLHYGDTDCPCIGFDNIVGETTVVLEGGEEVAFAADLGARCENWDDGMHPLCKGGEDKPKWCTQSWCFVDACNCNIPVLPKMTSYVPDARYRGKPIFFSYATCGGADTFSKVLPEIGTPGCRCIGFDNIPGSTDIRIGKEVISYPAEIGGSCRTWDTDLHPECKKGQENEPWCQAKWCYVDPCECNLKQPPKVTMYLPEASFTGKSLYYSYETCGSPDTFTEKYNLEACVNQQTKDKCEVLVKSNGHKKCAWTGDQCLGAELVSHPLCVGIVKKAKANETAVKSGSVACPAPAALVAMAALALAAVAM